MTEDEVLAQVEAELRPQYVCTCPYGGSGEYGCNCGSDGFGEAVDREVERRMAESPDSVPAGSVGLR